MPERRWIDLQKSCLGPGFARRAVENRADRFFAGSVKLHAVARSGAEREAGVKHQRAVFDGVGSEHRRVAGSPVNGGDPGWIADRLPALAAERAALERD